MTTTEAPPYGAQSSRLFTGKQHFRASQNGPFFARRKAPCWLVSWFGFGFF